MRLSERGSPATGTWQSVCGNAGRDSVPAPAWSEQGALRWRFCWAGTWPRNACRHATTGAMRCGAPRFDR